MKLVLVYNRSRVFFRVERISYIYFQLQLKMLKKNLIYIIISFLPMLILIFLYSMISPLVNTKIFKTSGFTVPKGEFIFIIIFLSGFGYYLSLWISEKVYSYISLLTKNALRILFNSMFSILIIILILSNLH